MFFSERFQISSELLKEYGAVDISLVCDIPLFIDPMLIFNSEKEIYKNLHKSIIRYFHFLYTKAEQGLTMIYEAANCTDGSLIAIFCFSESEYLYSEQVVKAAGYEELLGESIYLIDCRNDNKKSASIA